VPQPFTHIVETSAGLLFQVSDAGSPELAHVFRAMPVKRARGGFALKKGAREMMIRRLGCRVVAALSTEVA